MGSVKFEKGSAEWRMMADFWVLCKKFWIPEDRDEYWTDFIDEVNIFCERYKGEIFAKELAIAITKTLEEKHRVLYKNKIKQEGI